MKQIRVHFVDFSNMDNIIEKICSILSRHFAVIIDGENPEYVFYSAFGSEYLKYDCVRIFYTGENIVPDFNLCDYAIGFDHIKFLDRYLRYPLYLFYETDVQKAARKHQNLSLEVVRNKKRFCNFVVTNGKGDPYREKVFHALCAYKRVDSAGKFLNNVGARVKDKFAFQRECRFSLCFENSSTPGYLTEKLIQAAAAQTIPIYWGDTLATKPLFDGGGGINARAFINAHEFANIASLVRHIESIENDENAQLAILQEPLFLDSNHIELFEKQLEDFLVYIFSQPYERSFRRGKIMWQAHLEQIIKKGVQPTMLEVWLRRPLRNFERAIRIRVKKIIEKVKKPKDFM